jgi:hypothetical protein
MLGVAPKAIDAFEQVAAADYELTFIVIGTEPRRLPPITQRTILVYWDNGFVKYEWRSGSARRTRARIRRNGDPAEPPLGTLAADASITQEWDGTEMSAAIWCPEEAQHMKLREFKHSYTTRDRVLTLLLLESAEPRSWDRLWQDDESFDSYDQFVANGRHPVR